MNAEKSYLRSVERMLHGIRSEHRASVLDDLRGHFADAEEAGRPVDETIRGLGTPRQIAERAVEEFGADADAVSEQAWRLLQGAAIGMAVLIGVVAAFVLPSTTYVSQGGLDGTEVMIPSSTPFEDLGLAVALIVLIPAVLAAIPMIVPRRSRTLAAAVCAAVLTGASLVGGFMLGSFFLPVAMLAWAALIVWHVLRGRGFGLGWRIAGAALTALPMLGLLSLFGFPFLGGMPRRYADYSEGAGPSLGLEAGGWLIGLIVVALAVLIAVGWRWPGWTLAVIGFVVMAGGLLSGQLVTLLGIWLGGLWLTVGLAHAVSARRGRVPKADTP